MIALLSLISVTLFSFSAHATSNYEVEPKSQVIALLLNEHIHTTPQNKQLCLREVLFFSMKKGLVFCTHRPGDDVYKLKNPASTIPANMYFSREELNR